MDSAWRYIPIGRQLGERMGWHLQQSFLAGDVAKQWLRDTASYVPGKSTHSPPPPTLHLILIIYGEKAH